MAELAQSWDQLEEWEREEWWKRARYKRIRIRRLPIPQNALKGRSRSLRGEEFYIKINRVLEVCGYDRRRLPPPDPNFRPNPVEPDLRITLEKGLLKIMVPVRSAPTQDIMVFAAPPRRAGQGPGGNYAFIGLLPPPKNGESEITRMLLTKLKEWRKLRDDRYQVPLDGARICIRTWPQENGWEGKAWMQITHGLVPRRA